MILITAFADIETAIDALRASSDFVLKPFRGGWRRHDEARPGWCT